jgi:phosphopantothenoylcysteine decarboxylase/phosphopantothenate--cysteine ligase
VLLAFEGPVILAPAMNPRMWNKPAVQRNVRQLQEDGFLLIGPEEGYVSCGMVGMGRMAEPEKIFQCIQKILTERTPQLPFPNP